MFISEKQLVIRAARNMVRYSEIKFGTAKPYPGELGGVGDDYKLSNENGIIWYKNVSVSRFDKNLYIGEIHMIGESLLNKRWKEWHHIYGITPDGKLVLYAN